MTSRIRSERLRQARSRGTHTLEEWIDLKREFHARCVKCGRGDMHVERDHITPIYQGGSDAISNIQPLCAYCNTGKGPETTNWVSYRRKHGFRGDDE